MADKFRTTFPITVTLGDGEQPTAKKLNAISTQAKTGLALLERAIGDLWNQSGDSLTSNTPNYITNIARTLGNQSLMEAMIPKPDLTGVTNLCVKQSITPFLGSTQFTLDFLARNDAVIAASISLLDNLDSDNFNASPSATLSGVNTNTSWFYQDGTVYLGSPLNAVQTSTSIEYNILAADVVSDNEAGAFSLIPNPTQVDWKGLKISKISTNKYHIVLPFRRPNGVTTTSKLPAEDLNEVTAADVAAGKTRYWGPEQTGYVFSSTISSSRAYRHTLSQVALDAFNTGAGTIIPTGTLYLIDNNTKTIVEGIEFRIPVTTPTLAGTTGQRPFIIQLDGPTLDTLFTGLTSLMTTDAAADYKTRFSLMCVGESVASAVHSIKKELVEGNRKTGIQKAISHEDIVKGQPSHGTRFNNPLPPSFVPGDNHPHLLSRLGSGQTNQPTTHRDRYNNAMRGHLLMGSQTEEDNHQNLGNGDSFGLYFGAVSTAAPSIIGTYSLGRNILRAQADLVELGTQIVRINDTHIRALSSGNIYFGDDTESPGGTIWIPRIVFGGTTSNMNAFAAVKNTANWIEIKTAGGNQIRFSKSLDLSMDDAGAFGPNSGDVTIGDNDPDSFPRTNLRIAGGSLQFGASANPKAIVSVDSGDFYFSYNGSGLNANIYTGKVLLAGAQLHFTTNPSSLTGLKYFNNTGSGFREFTFLRDGLLANTKVIASTFEADNYRYATGQSIRFNVPISITAGPDITGLSTGGTYIGPLIQNSAEGYFGVAGKLPTLASGTWKRMCRIPLPSLPYLSQILGVVLRGQFSITTGSGFSAPVAAAIQVRAVIQSRGTSPGTAFNWSATGGGTPVTGLPVDSSPAGTGAVWAYNSAISKEFTFTTQPVITRGTDLALLLEWRSNDVASDAGFVFDGIWLNLNVTGTGY